MKDLNGQSCPINQKTVDESVVRIIAIQVFIGSILTLLFPQIWIPLFLMVDFSLRAFADERGSILRWNALQIKQLFSLETSGTNAAPKQFASMIGTIFSVLITLALIFEFQTAALILIAILTSCAALEGFFNYCVGCYFHQLLQRLSLIRS